ncbi:type III-B CRISPR module-associated protein Cmr5 [Candidatus Poribacteria bacterium]|nr:type III-B CRISPR module-associated protein Cmr5 [Candidatus Poribacteria bacterium]
MRTNSQKMAQAAYTAVAQTFDELHGKERDKYLTVSRGFPTLVHACGLAQAVAFARAKQNDYERYMKDLAEVLGAAGNDDVATVDGLDHASRNEPVSGYLRLSRTALQSANWIKRYAEALKED